MKTYENFIKNLFKKKPKIKYYPNGQKKSEIWSLNGKYHREDGPAYQWWYENGQKDYEWWYLNGKYHRDNGPAVQRWFRNGQKEYEWWLLNGKYHREDGPSLQRWSENGQKEYESWFLNNKRYTREKWVEELKKIGSKHYEEQQMLLDIEKYNI